MKFNSINNRSLLVCFRDALFQGIAPDGSLYVPSSIPRLPPSIFENLDPSSLHEMGGHVASAFIEEIPAADLRQIVSRAWNFPIPLIKLEERLFLLELFHGPTLAFKDIGARFMAEVMSYFLQQDQRHMTILVATSGDTGSAVAHGFYKVPNIDVLILYPSGKISHLQEQQMTTLGENIRAIEVEGTFDDCQNLLKQALNDPQIRKARTLTTANSINIGRLIPQIVYYIWATAQLRQHGQTGDPVVVVPSGNFGNLTAGLYAQSMGTPIQRFIAATNINDVVPQYFRTGFFTPQPSIQTMSNAMDVGNPSNLARLQLSYDNDVTKLRNNIDAVAISEEETLDEIRRTHKRTAYILDPHTAVGIAAARRTQKHTSAPIIVMATAHPAKFPEVIRRAIGIDIAPHPLLESAAKQEKKSFRLAATYHDFKAFLLKN